MSDTPHGIGTSGASKSASSGPRFCVVIPMYNEESGADACVVAVASALQPFADRATLIVVNDGSRDRTADIVRRRAEVLPGVILVDCLENQGYGSALRRGIERASLEGAGYVLFMDSDLTNDPADIPAFVREIDRGFDVVKATRFAAGGGMLGVPWRRSLISRAANVVSTALFHNGLTDCTNGFRAVRTSLLMRMSLRERGFAVIVEELWWCTTMGAKFAEIPAVLTARTEDLGRSAFAYTPSMFARYLRYALLAFWRLQPR
jgi:glycosyltransferase involved in cell wall biosynthesis